MSTQADPPERTGQGTSGTRLPAIAREWWVTALRGLVALTLALAIVVAGRGTARLVTFLALYWMTGGSSPSVRPGDPAASWIPAGIGSRDRGGRGRDAGGCS
jgi:hypothetical protein